MSPLLPSLLAEEGVSMKSKTLAPHKRPAAIDQPNQPTVRAAAAVAGGQGGAGVGAATRCDRTQPWPLVGVAPHGSHKTDFLSVLSIKR